MGALRRLRQNSSAWLNRFGETIRRHRPPVRRKNPRRCPRPAAPTTPCSSAKDAPWIDPLKEAKANRSWRRLAASEVEIIRRRGGNPRDVLEQIAAWRDSHEKGLTPAATQPPFNKPPARCQQMEKQDAE